MPKYKREELTKLKLQGFNNKELAQVMDDNEPQYAALKVLNVPILNTN